jgi:hypothetical protein
MRTAAAVGPRGTTAVAAVADATSTIIVTCVHGTWSRGARWPELEQSVIQTLGECGPVEVRYFPWPGRNSVKARTRAAEDLRALLRGDLYESPAARHVLIAHSHGATIVLNALDGADSVRDAVAAVVLLSPLLLNCQLVDDAAGGG